MLLIYFWTNLLISCANTPNLCFCIPNFSTAHLYSLLSLTSVVSFPPPNTTDGVFYVSVCGGGGAGGEFQLFFCYCTSFFAFLSLSISVSSEDPSDSWQESGVSHVKERREESRKRNHFRKERANQLRVRKWCLQCLRNEFPSLWCWASPGQEGTAPWASVQTEPLCASWAVADPLLGKSAVRAAVERKSLLIKLINKPAPNSDLQPLLGAKASVELMLTASCSPLAGWLWKGVKQGRLTSAAHSYCIPRLRFVLWTDNLTYTAPHRYISGWKDARDSLHRHFVWPQK